MFVVLCSQNKEFFHLKTTRHFCCTPVQTFYSTVYFHGCCFFFCNVGVPFEVHDALSCFVIQGSSLSYHCQITNFTIFSAPEPKAPVHYCDHALSVVRPSLTFHIFDFSSETAERNSQRLDRKQDLNALYQVCIFGPIRKTRWPPWPLIG